MTYRNVAIPVLGMMGYRAFFTTDISDSFKEHNLAPLFYLENVNKESVNADRCKELLLEEYNRILDSRFSRYSNALRRYIANTESSEIRFRWSLSESVWSSPNISRSLIRGLAISLLRQFQPIGPFMNWVEGTRYKTRVHTHSLEQNRVEGALINGAGNHSFGREGLFAREAQNKGIKVISAICNYDNIVSRGYRGFMPDTLAVWSDKMADQAMKIMRIPSGRIEVTGPLPFDKYFHPLKITREEFLTSIGLDPNLKTVLYAGTVSPTSYFDFLQTVEKLRGNGGPLSECNLVIRPYPHPKISSWSGMKYFRGAVSLLPNVYLSDATNSLDSSMYDNKLLDPSDDDLVFLLRYSDVMINYTSTISLEAAICDLPTININYDEFTYGIDRMFWRQNASALTHNLDALRIAAATNAYSEKELAVGLERYLEDRSLDSENRQEYARSECTYLDGNTSRRLAVLIDDIL